MNEQNKNNTKYDKAKYDKATKTLICNDERDLYIFLKMYESKMKFVPVPHHK